MNLNVQFINKYHIRSLIISNKILVESGFLIVKLNFVGFRINSRKHVLFTKFPEYYDLLLQVLYNLLSPPI
jgi:hypothetical protein